MKFIFLIFLLLLTLVSYSQEYLLFKKWTTGQEFYYAEKYNDSLITFLGGNLHEGGAMFTTKALGNNKHEIIGNSPENDFPPSIGEKGYTIELKEIENNYYLIVYNSKDKIQEVLFELKSSLEALVVKNKVNFELAGKYTDADGKEYIFYTNQLKADGFLTQKNYAFEYEFGFPIEVITFDTQSFFYEKLPEGLMLYEAIQNEYHEWEKSTRIKKLSKVEWFNHTGNQALKGKYPFASTDILTKSILTYFTKHELRIMRNEIFARHGYKFKTLEMKNYFNSTDWYHELYDDVNEKLTILEKLNIQIIKSVEEKM